MANTAMKNIRLPLNLQEQVINYIYHTWSNYESQQEFKKFMILLSPSICKDVYKQLYSTLVYQNDLFHNSNHLYQFVSQKLQNSFENPETEIIRQGDDVEQNMYFYFLIKGGCMVNVNASLNRQNFTFLKEGCHFGEVALLTEWPRTATVQASNYITLAKLDS